MASKWEDLLVFQMRAMSLPTPVAEYRFHPKRMWRFDFAFPALRVAIECEGAVWTQGRHTRGSGFVKDLEKYNTATMMGWKILRFDSGAIQRGEAVQMIKQIIKA